MTSIPSQFVGVEPSVYAVWWEVLPASVPIRNQVNRLRSKGAKEDTLLDAPRKTFLPWFAAVQGYLKQQWDGRIHSALRHRDEQATPNEIALHLRFLCDVALWSQYNKVFVLKATSTKVMSGKLSESLPSYWTKESNLQPVLRVLMNALLVYVAEMCVDLLASCTTHHAPNRMCQAAFSGALADEITRAISKRPRVLETHSLEFPCYSAHNAPVDDTSEQDSDSSLYKGVFMTNHFWPNFVHQIMTNESIPTHVYRRYANFICDNKNEILILKLAVRLAQFHDAKSALCLPLVLTNAANAKKNTGAFLRERLRDGSDVYCINSDRKKSTKLIVSMAAGLDMLANSYLLSKLKTVYSLASTNKRKSGNLGISTTALHDAGTKQLYDKGEASVHADFVSGFAEVKQLLMQIIQKHLNKHKGFTLSLRSWLTWVLQYTLGGPVSLLKSISIQRKVLDMLGGPLIAVYESVNFKRAVSKSRKRKKSNGKVVSTAHVYKQSKSASSSAPGVGNNSSNTTTTSTTTTLTTTVTQPQEPHNSSEHNSIAAAYTNMHTEMRELAKMLPSPEQIAQRPTLQTQPPFWHPQSLTEQLQQQTDSTERPMNMDMYMQSAFHTF